MGKIPTTAALRNWNINIDDVNRPFCNSNEETVGHIFTSCSAASIVWQHVSIWCKVTPFSASTVREILEIHDHVDLKGPAKDVLHGIIIIGCWSLWRARNGIKFENKQVRIEDIIREVKSVGYLWISSRLNARSISWTEWCSFVSM
ncbi:uncharacterized protein LOC110876206 [Helianthus annuus]|uniref:uncharacterized protein LOC110876206 n=1 Tax=Helianthus annuus TaxID=4232 RepID=UPI000B906B3A|nr:uncharacterized protein LOC110876206 [Helianthus annuus]